MSPEEVHNRPSDGESPSPEETQEKVLRLVSGGVFIELVFDDVEQYLEALRLVKELQEARAEAII